MAESASWAPFALSLVVFVAAHVVPTRPAVRARLVNLFGERTFLLLYSALSLGLLTWLVYSLLAAPVVMLWYYAPWQRWVPLVLMLPVCLLLAGALGAPNPLSIIGGSGERFRPEAPGVAGVQRHPLLLAFLLWALAHIPPNGELATVLFFAAMAAFSLIGMRALDRRRQRSLGAARWRELAGATSLLPGRALLSGRWRPDPRRLPLLRLAFGVALYAAFLLLHGPVIGVPALPPGWPGPH
jgi:uncharacterized membrane protein